MQIANSTPFPNQVLDEYWQSISGAEAKILGVIVRSTYGWIDKYTGKRKLKDWISHSQMSKKAGLSDRTVTTAIQSLIEKKMIIVTDTRGESLLDPQKRKFTQRIYYSLQVDNTEKTTDHQRKNYDRPTQNPQKQPQQFQSTENNQIQKPFVAPQGRVETDAERLQQIAWEAHQRNQREIGQKRNSNY